MPIRVIKTPITRAELAAIAAAEFGDVVKVVVDAEQGIMVVGGELHADEEVLLTEECGSKREHTWGINLYPKQTDEDWIEFDSMINLKPSLGNRSRGVEDPAVREQIAEIIKRLVLEP